jgi:negative regulator of flagellin synthesis FlgM
MTGQELITAHNLKLEGEVMSVEFFGVGGPGQIGNLKKSQKTQPDKSVEGIGQDKVQFSSVLQDVNKAKATTESGDAARTERVQQLKAQIQDGSYEPDLKKVSASLLQFLVEGK